MAGWAKIASDRGHTRRYRVASLKCLKPAAAGWADSNQFKRIHVRLRLGVWLVRFIAACHEASIHPKISANSRIVLDIITVVRYHPQVMLSSGG